MSGGDFRLTPPTLSKMTKRGCSMAGPKDVRNKWLAEFKETHCYSEFGKMLYRLLRRTSDDLDAKEDAELMKIEVKRLETVYEEFFEYVEAEPVARFDEMMEKASKNTTMFHVLATRLSEGTVEKICNHMFATPDINALFIQSFFINFLPIFLKRPYSWLSLDILVKAHQAQPESFRILLPILLKDTDIQSIMINDFVVTLNEDAKNDFLNVVMDTDMNHREFGRNISAIHSAYKSVEKTERLQSYIFRYMARFTTFYANDWNCGRLLLSFLQASGEELNIAEAERIVATHRTPFKRACQSVLNALVERVRGDLLPQNPS